MRTYVRRGARAAYSRVQLLEAVERVRHGAFMKDVSADTGIPLRSLRRQKNKGITRRPGKSTVFTAAQEAELKDYIVACTDRFYGLSREEARKLAADFAQANRVRIPRGWTASGLAGLDWLAVFQKRDRLSLRSPEATSMARANGFNAKAVDQFFANLVALLEKFRFDSGRIVNLDETGITNVAICPKVLAPTGRKQVGQVTAAERGTLVTVVGCVANDGNTIPPVLLFPRLRVPVDRLGRGAPPGTLTLNSATGWMTAEIFATDVLPHIVRHTKASQDNPILLLVDNHASHVSLEAVRFCRANGIHVLTFPPHCSHRLQPLDVAVYGPMKSAYKRALHDHQMAHPGRRIDLYQMADIFRRAYDGSFTRKNILKGFEASGVSPLNRDVFDETDFAPAAVSVPVVVPSADQPAAAVAGSESPAVAELEPEPTRRDCGCARAWRARWSRSEKPGEHPTPPAAPGQRAENRPDKRTVQSHDQHARTDSFGRGSAGALSENQSEEGSPEWSGTIQDAEAHGQQTVKWRRLPHR